MITIGRNIARSVRPGRSRALLHAAAALLTLSVLAAPASARPFQQYLNGACTGNLCKINFAAVPAGHRMDIKNASCYLRLNQVVAPKTPQIRAMQILVLGAGSPNVVSAVTMAPSLTGTAGIEFMYSAAQPLASFAGPQQRFQAYVEIRQATFSQFACHISGDLERIL